MGKIDTSGWKEFRIGDLFEACLSKDDIQPKDFVEGKIPLVSSGKENNGIIAFVEDEKARLWDKNTLTIDMFGKVFYQESPYFAVSHGRVNILLPKISMTKWCLQFIGCAIEKVASQKYAFNEMCTGTKVLKDNIKLPAAPDGAPDWTYMESYMANIETKVAESLTLLQAARDAEKKKVDTREWGEFRVGELFDAERGKVKNIQPLTPGATPIIAAGAYNQGIAGMYAIDSAYKNRITVSCNGAGCGSTFYHPYEFNVNGDAITLIEKKCMSDRAKQFVACILNATFTRKFSYEEKCSPQKALAEAMRLPIDKTGQPDWAYMEEYMRKVKERVKVTMEKYEMTVNEVAL